MKPPDAACRICRTVHDDAEGCPKAATRSSAWARRCREEIVRAPTTRYQRPTADVPLPEETM